MKTKKFSLFVLATLLMYGCNLTYTYWKPKKYPDTEPYHIAALNDHHVYYRAIFRNEERLEYITNRNDSSDKVHLTDLHYFMINEKDSTVILLSFMPTMKVQGATKYYMDEYLKGYEEVVNIYYLGQLLLGKLHSDHFHFQIDKNVFSEKNFDIYFYRNMDSLILYKLDFPLSNQENNQNIVLNGAFEPEYCYYNKADKVQFIFFGPKKTGNHYVLNDTILFYNSGIGENGIYFNYDDEHENNELIKFRSRNNRFNFQIN